MLLLNKYKKYENCISVLTFDHAIDSIFQKVKISYSNLAVLSNNEFVISGSVNEMIMMLFTDDDEKLQEEKIVFIIQFIDFIKRQEKQIITMLNKTDKPQIRNLLMGFEDCLQMVEKLITQMEMMLKNMQYINQQYLRISA